MSRKNAFHQDDLRFRRNEKEPKPKLRAVVLLAMDQSGSMNAERIMIARAVSQYFLRWLRSKREYKSVEVVFIKQEGLSEEVTEEKFFTRTGSGGTKFSTAWELMNEMIDERFPPAKYNVYGMHYTDGENEAGDNDPAEKAMKLLLPKMNLFGYLQFQKSSGANDMLERLTRIQKEHGNLKTLFAGKKHEVLPALEEFLQEA